MHQRRARSLGRCSSFALFDGILDGLRNIACASDVGAFGIFVYDDLPVPILGTYNVVGK